jgi:hypothetical protein
MNKQKTLVSLLALVLPLCAFPFAAHADEQAVEERIVLAEATPLSSEEMQDLRGGFIDPTGMIYNFSVNVKTALDGSEVFTRSLNVSPSGPGGQFQATTNANLMPQNFPSNVSVSMIGNGNGVAVTDAAGQRTTILNETASGAPASIILNTHDDRNIAQTVNLTLTLKNMASSMNLSRAANQSSMVQRFSGHGLGF